MDYGQWRYGQPDEPAGQSEPAAPSEPPGTGGAPPPSGPPTPNGGPAPNLWSDEPVSGGWDPWRRSEQPPLGPGGGWQHARPSPDDSDWHRPGPDDSGWHRPGPDDSGWQHARPSPDDSGWQRTGDWGPPGDPTPVPRPALPELPSPAAAQANLPPPSLQPTELPRTGSLSHIRRTGIDTWSPPEDVPRRHIDENGDLRPRRGRRSRFEEEPSYGPVLGYTGAWFGVPALLYLVWIFTLDDTRQALVGRQLLTSLPWLVAAMVLSLAVAALLRWAVVGWRAVTLGFASAVIGAGMVTIAHSLTL